MPACAIAFDRRTLLLSLACVVLAECGLALAASPARLDLRLSEGLSAHPDRAVPPASAGPSGVGLQMIGALHAGAAQAVTSGDSQELRSDATPFGSTLLEAVRRTAQVGTAAIAVLIAWALLTRSARNRRLARESEFGATWRPVVYARMAGDDVALPSLAAADRLLFLGLFLETLASVRGEAADALAQVARELDMGPYILGLLKGRVVWKRVIAIECAAALGLQDAVGPLLRIAARGPSRSSLAAAAALLRINPERGAAAIASILAKRDWSPAAVASMLKHAGLLSGMLLTEMIRSPDPRRIKKAVKLVELLGDSSVLEELRGVVARSGDPEVIAAGLHALAALGGAADRDTAIAFLSHSAWIVRMQAAHALGELGREGDAARLEPLLRDPSWWVRYRVAQALFRLVGPAAVSETAERESDPLAREMIRRVLAEQS